MRLAGGVVAPRFYASGSARPPSQHTMFYKTFGRPVFKVFLMAMFTYQMLYLAWVRLEHGEEREQRQAEIDRLEEQVQAAQQGQAPKRA
jgi:hypothetical protein